MDYIAHRNENDGRTQSILAHLNGTAALAKRFASAFGTGDEGYRCGMLHDIGKYSAAFQQRIRGAAIRVDHSTAGAVEAIRVRDVPAAFCIAGHHGGLPDGGSTVDPSEMPTLRGRLNRAHRNEIEDYSSFKQEVDIPTADIPQRFCRTATEGIFFTRMLYSCLVDADYLDTERFIRNEAVERGGFSPLSVYREKLESAVTPWLSIPRDELGEKRSRILRACLNAGSAEPGLFTLTAPTGSGKTLSSMAFALSHTQARDKRRVIYIIPYCSIIEQTQSVFERVFGSGAVVAHYSDVEYRSAENEAADREDRRYLAAENWDAPIILTTTVQFFESLFSNRPSRCRKLHNLADSVLIFDEAQMLPVPFLRPCVLAVSELVRNYGCTAVLCTATQPALDRLFAERENLPGVVPRELCPDREEMYRQFRRVQYTADGRLTDSELVKKLRGERQVLCIVNRRDQAQELFSMLPADGRFHLSTAMCPEDRSNKLEIIRECLRNGKTCRVISTSLVEAGVDVSFPAVYRALAGLDSIIQAGGRCNREGDPGRINGTVHVFESDRPAPKMLCQNIAVTKSILEEFSDIASPEAIQQYFDRLFYYAKGEDALDSQNILTLCADHTMPFAEISRLFRIIDNAQYTVYIPRPENKDLLSELRYQGPNRSLMRKLGRYSVGVYPNTYADLKKVGAIHEIAENAAVLDDIRRYDPDMGLELTAEEGVGNFL